jgi:hypothetical protein
VVDLNPAAHAGARSPSLGRGSAGGGFWMAGRGMELRAARRRPAVGQALPGLVVIGVVSDLSSRVAIERSFRGSFVGRGLPHHRSGADG